MLSGNTLLIVLCSDITLSLLHSKCNDLTIFLKFLSAVIISIFSHRVPCTNETSRSENKLVFNQIFVFTLFIDLLRKVDDRIVGRRLLRNSILSNIIWPHLGRGPRTSAIIYRERRENIDTTASCS